MKLVLNLIFIINIANCVEKQTPKVKNILPNFRRQVEEIPEEFTTEKSEDDANINLVAFLVKNAKEIFGETETNTDVVTKTPKNTKGTTSHQDTTLLKDRRTLPTDRTFSDENTFLEQRPALEERTILKEKSITEEKLHAGESTYPIANAFTESSYTNGYTNDEGTLPLFTVKPSQSLLKNVTTDTITDYTTVWSPTRTNTFSTISSMTTTTAPYSVSSPSIFDLQNTTTQLLPTRTTGIDFTINVESIKSDFLNITHVQIMEKGKKDQTVLTRKQDRIHDDISIYNVPVSEKELGSLKRSCIICNNIQMHECNDPKNKMLPNTRCGNEEDLCYTQQTPFGLIDRGCFNVNQNITTYVCSCNLCNYIPISDMPYKFTKRKDWLDNIIDLSRTRNLRSSIFKNMSCLSCEVNSTTSSIPLEHAHCLQGNIGILPKVQCADDEICGIKALKNKDYMWRGCLKSPLYNYWWSLCDSDLCNTDSIVSLYDEIR